MKILVLGAAGMAGHTIALYFQQQGHDVTAYTTRPFSYFRNNIVGNALDTEAFRAMLLEGGYDAVINCIGLLNKTAEDRPAQAVYLNSYLPHLVADTLKDTPARLIHMSTDCVFAGNTGPYAEDALRDGRTFYDRTKALGEVEDGRNLTFRNSIVGPDMNPEGIGLFNWFMKQQGPINGFTEAMWTGVTTLTLAKAMERALEEGLSGLYNLVNDSNISKYDLLGLFNRYFCEGRVEIRPSGSLHLDKTLVRTRRDFSFAVPDYERQVAEMKQWVDDHKELYPHYFALSL